MFTSTVVIIKMSKMAHIFFSVDDTKKSFTVWVKYFSASERSYLAFLENAIEY